MFQSISWSEFLTTAGVGLALYYGVSSILLYSEEIKYFFSNGFKQFPVSNAADQQNGGMQHSVVGPAKNGRAEKGESILLAGPEESQLPSEKSSAEIENTPKTDSLLVGSVADLGQEIKTLCARLAQYDRNASIREFKSLLNKYSKIASTSYRSTINLLISETVKELTPHRFGLKEIDLWWESR